MGRARKNNGSFDESKLVLQTMAPSDIRKPSGDGTSSSVASTPKGSQSARSSAVDLDSPSSGWTKVRHPDWGAYYYVNADKGVCTLSNVLDDGTCSLIMESAEKLQEELASQGFLGGKKVGLVFGVRDTEQGKRVSYYCVSHAERSVFWLERREVHCTSKRCKKRGLETHCAEAQYWKHCELFPTTFTVTKRVTGDLKAILLQAAADRLLVKFPTSPYDKHDLEYMLNVVKEIEDLQEANGRAAWIIARFMALYNDGVLQSSYDQGYHYFDVDDKRKGKVNSYQYPTFLAIFSPVFLRTPNLYAEELHSFRESFSLARLSSFVDKVDQSIRDSNLLATVLLSTNMGFLAWSDGGKPGVNNPTAAQIVTYISIICSVGSIITGLAIYKQYRAKGVDTPQQAVLAMGRILDMRYGPEVLAIVCSLPYVLLMWGLIAFLAAFGIIFYQDTGIEVRIPVTLALFLGVLCLLCCLYIARVAGKDDRKEDQCPQKQSGRDKAILSRV